MMQWLSGPLLLKNLLRASEDAATAPATPQTVTENGRPTLSQMGTDVNLLCRPGGSHNITSVFPEVWNTL